MPDPRPVKILAVTPDFPPAPGGIQLVAHRMVAHLTRVRARVVAVQGPGGAEFDAGQPFEIRRARAPTGDQRVRMLALNAATLREARRFRPDVVLSLHIVASLATVAVARALGVPYVQYVHADEVGVRPRLARFALANAAAVVAVSRHAEALAVRAGAPQERIHRIPPGVDLPPEGDGRVRTDRPTLLTVARLTQRYKGHDVILRALGGVRAAVPGVRWVVVGDGPLREELEALAASEGVADAVEFRGSVPDHERDGWLDSAHVFAMPSRLPPGRAGGEGFGIVYLEANAHGLPVVAGRVGGALDSVVDGETGVLVDPTSPAEVGKAITALLLDPGRAEALGRAGAQRAEDFAWPRVAGRLEALLLDVAGPRAGAS